MRRPALQHAEGYLGLSYPKDECYVRMGFAPENGLRRLKGNPFRAFVHPAAEMRRLADGVGFRLTARHQMFMRCTDVYRKVPGSFRIARAGMSGTSSRRRVVTPDLYF